MGDPCTKGNIARCSTLSCMLIFGITALSTYEIAKEAEADEDATVEIQGTLQDFNVHRFNCSRTTNSRCSAGGAGILCSAVPEGTNAVCSTGSNCCVHERVRCSSSGRSFGSHRSCRLRCDDFCRSECSQFGATIVSLQWGTCARAELDISITYPGSDSLYHVTAEFGFNEPVPEYRRDMSLAVHYHTEDNTLSLGPPEPSGPLYTLAFWGMIWAIAFFLCCLGAWREQIAKAKDKCADALEHDEGDVESPRPTTAPVTTGTPGSSQLYPSAKFPSSRSGQVLKSGEVGQSGKSPQYTYASH